jgi:hypothetical protein
VVNAERLRLDEADSGGVPWSRWGEDGLAGISDDKQQLCLALGLWNGRDPILKERLFGLTNAEGNHGEDVKECYFYLDATPTSSYLKMLYKYPQAEFPYAEHFHGDDGAGIGASHQTGWTGTAGLLPLLFCGVSTEGLRTGGRGAIKRAASGRRMEAAR